MRYALIAVLALFVLIVFFVGGQFGRDENCIAWQESGYADENGKIVMKCLSWAAPGSTSPRPLSMPPRPTPSFMTVISRRRSQP